MGEGEKGRTEGQMRGRVGKRGGGGETGIYKERRREWEKGKETLMYGHY